MSRANDFLATSRSSVSRAALPSVSQSLSVTPRQAVWYACVREPRSRNWYMGADRGTSIQDMLESVNEN